MAPFATWAYRPNYLPPGFAIEFAENVPYLPFLHRMGPPAHEPTDHSLPIRELCSVAVGIPSVAGLSKPSREVLSAGLVSYRCAAEHVLELAFAAAEETVFDLRPNLPLLLRGVVQDAA